MAENPSEKLKKLLYDPRRCGDPASVLKCMGMLIGKALTVPDDLVGLSDQQAQRAIAFLERWFPDRTSTLIESICIKAQVAP